MSAMLQCFLQFLPTIRPMVADGFLIISLFIHTPALGTKIAKIF